MDKAILLIIFIVLFILSLSVGWFYAHKLRSIIKDQYQWIFAMTTGSLLTESLATVAHAYGFRSIDELMDVLERVKRK